jgi:hypothetical protein
MSWITPIIDRSLDDVKNLKLLMTSINEQGWDNVSSEIKSQWFSNSKGCINSADLNRIENNIDYIVQQLGIMGVTVVIDTSNPVWNLGSDITLTQFNKIRDNLNAVKNAWYTLPTTPVLKYTFTVDYNDANAIEQMTADFKYLLDLVFIQVRPICGKAICGNQSVL